MNATEIIVSRIDFENMVLKIVDASKGYNTYTYGWPPEMSEWMDESEIKVWMICRLVSGARIEYGFGFDNPTAAVHFRLRWM